MPAGALLIFDLGYTNFRSFLELSAAQVTDLVACLEALWQEEGDRAGQEVIIEPGARRLANLINKGEVFRPVFTHPLILEAAQLVLGPHIRLGSLNARSVPPHFFLNSHTP